MAEEKNLEPQVEVEHRKIEIPLPAAYIYSNVASVAMSQWDVRLNFAEVFPDGKVETRIGVALPPEHAAALAIILMQHLHIFEDKFGLLREPRWNAVREQIRGQVKPSSA